MPTGKADYEIAVKTTADTGAIKDTAAGIQEVSKQTEKTTDALKDTSKAHEDAGEKGDVAAKLQKHGAEEVTLSHRELREAVHAVARQFGGLADVGLWLNPTTAALAILLTGVEAIKKVFEELQQPVDAANAALRAIDATKLKSAADAAHALSDSLGEIGSEEDRLDAAYRAGDAAIDARIKKYGEEQDAILKLLEAREKLLEAQIDADPNKTKEQKDAEKEAARLQLDKDRAGTDLAKQKFLIDTKQKELDQARQRLQSGADVRAIASNQGDINDTRAALDLAQTNQKNIEEGPIEMEFGKSFKNREELAKAQKEASDKLQELQENGADLSKPVKKGDTINEEAAMWAKEKQALDAAMRSHDSYVANLAQETNTAQSANNAAKNREEMSKDRLKKDEELNRTGPGTIRGLQDAYDIQQRNAADIQSVNTQAANVRTGGALANDPRFAGAALPGSVAAPAPTGPPLPAADAPGVIANAQYALRLLEHQRGGVQPNQQPAVHTILDRIVRLLENPQVQANHNDDAALQDVEHRLSTLESRLDDYPHIRQ